MQTLVESLRERARLHPGRTALIGGGERVSYEQLWRRVCAASAALARASVGRGDRVLLDAPSAPAFVCGYFAAHALGAVAVPVDCAAPAWRREELAARIGAAAVFSTSPGAGVRDLGELGSAPAAEAPPEPPPLDALADVLFTTGTTGRAKGVLLTHRNLAAAAARINAAIAGHEGAVEVLPLPLHHGFGLGRLRCSLLAGRTLVLLDGVRLPGDLLAAVEEHGATGLAAVPPTFAMLLRFGGSALARLAERLRYVEIGSGPMALEHKRALQKSLPRTELWMQYGLTEAGRCAFLELHRHRERLDSVGLAARDVQLTVRDADGIELEAGVGLLWAQSAAVSPGYFGDPELTARTFAGGAMCTGDLAEIDGDGFVTLRGRRDELIKVAGYAVSPEEVERVLATHPAVREAACVGVADPRGFTGQVLRACLVMVEGAPPPPPVELARFVAARLEHYKVPAEFRWLPALPRSATGKLLRASLRADAPELRGG